MPASSPDSALIIGASRGLGLALAQEYLKRGWRVVGTVRRRTALHDLADRYGGRLEVETLDAFGSDAVAFVLVMLPTVAIVHR